MLTSRDLERARADFAEVFPDTAVIKRQGGTTSASGATRSAFDAIGTVVARIDPENGTGNKQMYAGREGGIALYRLTMPYNTDLNATDKVVINTVTYQVKEVNDAHSDRLTVRAIVAKVAN